MMRRTLSISAFAMALVSSTSAQEGGASPEMDAALAAGWKAGFICSATFNARQPLDEIEANELDGIYPDFRDAFAELPEAVIDTDAKTVSVDWSDTLPPRVAAWRPTLGCSQLPIGAGEVAREALPEIDVVPVWHRPRVERLTPDEPTKAPLPFDDEALSSLVETAFSGDSYGANDRTSAVLIAQNNTIIAEAYGRGVDADTPQRTWSVAKSFSASVIGAAVQKELIDIEAPVGLEDWQRTCDPRGSITFVNLMHMASGLDSGRAGNRTDRLYFGGGLVKDEAADTVLEAAPGTRFKYANNDTLLLMRGLREWMEDDAAFLRFPYEALLWKIGAINTTMETDWGGDFLSSSQVWTTAGDMAKLGQLYLQDGVWGGERILPERWAEFASTPAPAQPTRGAFGYGAQFWLFDNVEGVPSDTYAALGNRGQHLVIIPSMNLIIVRRGYDINGGARFDVAAFTRDVVALFE